VVPQLPYPLLLGRRDHPYSLEKGGRIRRRPELLHLAKRVDPIASPPLLLWLRKPHPWLVTAATTPGCPCLSWVMILKVGKESASWGSP
jgi:hypothetical protein